MFSDNTPKYRRPLGQARNQNEEEQKVQPKDGVKVKALVLDFSEAFSQVPIHPSEKRFFCATTQIDGKRKFIASTRVAQGSANGPNLWGRVLALIMRLSKLCFIRMP